MELTFENIKDGDFDAVSDLIMNMYNHHLKRYYTEKGDASFRKDVSAKALKKRADKGAYIYSVKEGDELVGVLEFNSKNLAQFFIVDEFRGRGYGRMTINWLKSFYKEHKLAQEVIVKASPNAYLAFEKMGFAPIGIEKNDGVLICKEMSIGLN